jgi:MFS family permease
LTLAGPGTRGSSLESSQSRLRLLQLLLLAAANWAVSYAAATLGPLQETLRGALSLSDNQIAWLQGPALAIPLAATCIPLGLLVDRYSRTRLFVLFTALSLLGSVASALAPNLGLLFAARCMVGLAAVITVAAYSLVGDLYPPEQRGRATMVVSMGEICGQPAAFALGGFLLAMSATRAHEEHWRWALLWMSVPVLPVVLLMLTMREPRRSEVSLKDPPLRAVLPALWRDRALILPLLSGRIMMWLAIGAVAVWAAPTFSRNFALPPQRVGAIVGGTLLLGAVLGPLLGGPLADFCQKSGGPRRTIAALGILAILSAPTALFGILHGPTAATILLGAFLTLGSIIGVAASALAIVAIPGELRGIYVAITITVGSLVFMGIAPLAVSGLASILGGPDTIGQALAIVCCGTSLLGAVVFTFGSFAFGNARIER